MSTFDEASLVFIPSGYKTSKTYSVKPSDGTGDLTFTRSNDTATRVGPDGLIEKVRTNLFPYSQDFSTAAWTKEGTMTETFSQTDPNGGTTGVLVTSGSSGNAYYGHNITCVANVPNTFSIYIKGNASGSVSIRIDDSTTGPQFNINYTTSWQRFSVTRTPNQTGCSFVIGGYGTWDVGESLSFAFAQSETSDIATDYIATTTAAVSVGPVGGLPRLDYLNSTCPRLLLEPQRTNLVTYSEQFDNTAWGKVSATITANTTISPDGYQNADTFATTGGGARIFETFSLGAGTYTVSLYVKKLSGSGNMRFFGIVDGGGVSQSFTPTTEWQRFSGVFTAATGITEMQLREDGFSGTLAIYGFQIEAGAYATSYIPTLGAAVTRGADACSKTGISSLIGQTEGTIFIDVNIDNVIGQVNNPVLFYLKGTSVETYIELYNTLQLEAIHFNSGTQCSIISAASYNAGRYKIAFAYKTNDFAFYVNGVQIGTDTSGTVGAQSEAGFQYYNTAYNGQQKVNQALLFKTRLTNSELSALTTI